MGTSLQVVEHQVVATVGADAHRRGITVLVAVISVLSEKGFWRARQASGERQTTLGYELRATSQAAPDVERFNPSRRFSRSTTEVWPASGLSAATSRSRHAATELTPPMPRRLALAGTAF